MTVLRDRLDHLEDGAQALTILVEQLAEALPDDFAIHVAGLRFAARAISEGTSEAVVTARRIAGE